MATPSPNNKHLRQRMEQLGLGLRISLMSHKTTLDLVTSLHKITMRLFQV